MHGRKGASTDRAWTLWRGQDRHQHLENVRQSELMLTIPQLLGWQSLYPVCDIMNIFNTCSKFEIRVQSLIFIFQMRKLRLLDCEPRLTNRTRETDPDWCLSTLRNLPPNPGVISVFLPLHLFPQLQTKGCNWAYTTWNSWETRI